MAELSFRNISKSYGDTEVVAGFNLEVRNHEFIVFLGPSGCGKSTILRMIAGLEDITGGELSIDGRVVNQLPPRDRNIAMVFQNYALYPHMSVRDNIAFGLKRMKIAPDEIDRRIKAAAATLGLEQFLARKSTALSGGQQQRVAIARAIVKTPGVFLFDEPLSNLDAKLRNHMRVEIARLHQRLKTTTVYVTHDQLEAMTLADRIVLLRNGLIEQVGTPREIFERPDSQFVAAFIGTPAMNFFEVDVNGSELDAPGRNAPALFIDRERFDLDGSKTIVAGVRPAHFRTASASDTVNVIDGDVDLIEFLGNDALINFKYAGVEIGVLLPAQQCPAVGDHVRMTFSDDNLHVFDKETGRSLARMRHGAEERRGPTARFRIDCHRSFAIVQMASARLSKQHCSLELSPRI
jgi:multiple sugar transport system ATP-binding protein